MGITGSKTDNNDSVTEQDNQENDSATEEDNEGNDSTTEQGNEDNGSITEHNNQNNGSITEHYNQDNDSITEHYNPDNGSKTEHSNPDNDSITEHYNRDDSTSEHYNQDNGSIIEHYNQENDSITEHYVQGNDNTIEHYNRDNIVTKHQENNVTSNASTVRIQNYDDGKNPKNVQRKKVKVGKVEKLFVLNAYRTHPGDFESIICSLKRDKTLLPPSAMNLYEFARDEALKKRVTKIFLRTMDEGDSDDEITEGIKLIKEMEAKSMRTVDNNTQPISHLKLPIKRQLDNQEEYDAGTSKIRRIRFIDNNRDNSEEFNNNGDEETTGSSNVRNIGFENLYNNDYNTLPYCVNNDYNAGPFHDNVSDNGWQYHDQEDKLK